MTKDKKWVLFVGNDLFVKSINSSSIVITNKKESLKWFNSPQAALEAAERCKETYPDIVPITEDAFQNYCEIGKIVDDLPKRIDINRERG